MINNSMAIKILKSLFTNNWAAENVYEGSDRDFIVMREGANAGEKGKGYFLDKGIPELYMGLYTVLPNTKGEGGTEVPEENNYQRIPLHGQDSFNNGYIFTGAEIDSNGVATITNKQDIVFPVATKSGWAATPREDLEVEPDPDNPDHWNNAPIVGFGIFTTPTKTNETLILWGALTADNSGDPEPVIQDTILKIPKGQFKVTFS